MTTRPSWCTVTIILAAAFAWPAALIGAQPTWSTTIDLLPPLSHYATGYPWRTGSLALGDLDGTGTVDAAVPGTYIGSICVVLDGTTQTWFAAGRWPIALDTLDYDGDGDTDLVVAEQNGGGIAIMLNDGQGNFTRGAFIPTGTPGTAVGPHAVKALDFDNDGGWTDLIVANRWAGTVMLLKGTSAGFAYGQVIPVSHEPNALAAADFDGNGCIDIAVACAADDSVKVIMNDGALLPARTFEGGPYPIAIAAGDLDNDGDVDLVVANREAPQVTVLLNDGTGSFTSRGFMLVGQPGGPFNPPTDVQLVDASGDGYLDIRCGGRTLLNSGAGTFTLVDTENKSGAVYARYLPEGADEPVLGMAHGWIVTVAPPAVLGDINDDGIVDARDLLAMARAFNTTKGDALYDPASDYNGDGAVNALDLLTLARFWPY